MAEKEREKDRLVEQGQQLMHVSSEVRSADIEQRISRLEDKWQHLRAVTDFRERKLQETVLAVKQLDASMRNLSQWLTDMEQELNATITYPESDLREIQRKLEHQQELQRDIERHSAGVASVLNLCEVLLHDSDACPTDVEFNALQHSMKSLDRRWRQICSMSPDRRVKIETTWQMWETFRSDCVRMCEWLRQVEADVRDQQLEHRPSTPRSADTSELESLQRRVHDRLTDVENINKQYRRLSREGRCDAAGSLKLHLQEVNDRWDGVQQQISRLMRELQQSSSIRQEFQSKRSALLQWLTEVDMQLTNIEHLYQMDISTKMKEMKRILEEVEWRRSKMTSLDQAAIYLIQHGDQTEAEQIQHDLDEFKDFSRKVLDRATNYQAKLQRIAAGQVEDIAKLERREGDVDETWKERELRQREVTLEWDITELEDYLKSSPPDVSPPESPPHKRRASPRAVLRRRSPSPSKWRDSASPRRRSQSPVRRGRLSVVDPGALSVQTEQGSSRLVEALLEKLAEALEEAAFKLMAAERELKASLTGRDSDTLSLRVRECEKAMENVQSLERLLKTESRQTTISSVDTEICSVTTRWELLQSRLADRRYQSTQQRQDLRQFRTDLANMLVWLDEAEALQAVQRPLPTDVIELNSVTRQYKDFLLQMESKKTRVLSINLISKSYIDGSSVEGREMRDQLRQINRRWEILTAQATAMQADLQVALIQCHEFHHEIHDLLLWLESIETRLQRCEPIYEPSDQASLWDKYHRLKEIHRELEARHPRVVSLKDTADQLLEDGTSEEMVQAKSKMHIIANRLRALLRLSASYIQSLENKLDISGRRSLSTSLDLSEGHTSGLGSSRASRSSTPRLDSMTPSRLSARTRSPFAFTRQLLFGTGRPLFRSTSSADSATSSIGSDEEGLVAVERRPSFVVRVLRTAIPLQLLLLLLLGIACLVPMADEDYCCVVTNNFQKSLEPMLRYTDGPPPA